MAVMAAVGQNRPVLARDAAPAGPLSRRPHIDAVHLEDVFARSNPILLTSLMDGSRPLVSLTTKP